MIPGRFAILSLLSLVLAGVFLLAGGTGNAAGPGPGAAPRRLPARFEPPDGRVIHGWGQNYNILLDRYSSEAVPYITACGAEFVLFSDYYDISLPPSECTPTAHAIHTAYGNPYVPLIGICWLAEPTDDGKVAAGLHDGAILKLAQDCRRVDGPVFIRPGFEFGPYGCQSGVTSPEHFADAWVHIHELFEKAGVTNVAWVWNTVGVESWNGYMDYYPGDAYVDWWGVNIFTYGQLNCHAFIEKAAQHGKPVMIPESCPSLSGGGTAHDPQWELYFTPYFALFQAHPNLKAFVYLNLDWTQDPFWNWPDTRIQINEYIRGHYETEMTSPRYIHMDELIAHPGILGP